MRPILSHLLTPIALTLVVAGFFAGCGDNSRSESAGNGLTSIHDAVATTRLR